MKNKAFLLVTFLAVGFVLQAQQVEQNQRALVCKMTATWCQYCGSWGATAWDDLVEQNEASALMFQLHFSTSSDLYTPTTKAIYDQFVPSNSTPVFYVNGVSEMQQSSQGINVTQSKLNVTNAVNAAWQSQPVANVGFDFVVSGNQLSVNSKTRFFTDTTGEYYVAAYIALDNMEAEQNVQGQGYIDRVHDNVIQHTMTSGSHFGLQQFNGAISSGAEATQAFTYNLNSAWTLSDVWVVCMIWKKEGTKYVYVNGTEKRLAEPTGILTVPATLDVAVYPTVSSSKITVETGAQGEGASLQVVVQDMSGRTIATLQNAFTGGNQSMVLDKNLHFNGTPGMYLLTITAGSQSATRKVLIE